MDDAVNDVDYVLVSRLCEVYWPVWMRNYYARHDPRRPGPVSDFVPDDKRTRRRGYDVQRVRFFLNAIRQRRKLEPIQVESSCAQYRIGTPPAWGPPQVVDGHHRFVAAVLSKKRRIAVSFGGVVDDLKWLRGDTNKKPLW